jgi:hypothetical protein
MYECYSDILNEYGIKILSWFQTKKIKPI